MLGLLAVASLAAALRFRALGANSLSYKEITAVHAARQAPSVLLPAVRDLHRKAPLGFAILHWVASYGVEEARLRTVSALSGVAAVVALAWLAFEIGGAAMALLASLLLAGSPFHISLSQDVRPYSLCAALIALALVLLWRLLNGRGSWPLAALVATAAAYSGYAGFLVLVGAALFSAGSAVARREARRPALRALAACVVAATSFIPWMVYDLGAGIGAQLVAPNVSWRLVARLGRAFAGEAPHPSAAVAFGALALLGFAWMLWRRPAAALFITIAGGGALAGELGVARMAPYLFAPEQALFVLPLYLLLVAAGVAALAAAVPVRIGAAGVWVLAAAAVIWLALPTLRSRGVEVSSDWRGAAQVVVDNIGKDDALVAPNGDTQLLFYAPGLERRLTPTRGLVGVVSTLREPPRVWLVAPWQARLLRGWKAVAGGLAGSIVVDLSPSPDPAVYFVTNGVGRSMTYWMAAQFDLPIAVLARGTFTRDCLRELGAIPEVLELVDRLTGSRGIALRNPALLQVLTLLKADGQLERARELAAHIAAREPDWEAARAAVVALQG